MNHARPFRLLSFLLAFLVAAALGSTPGCALYNMERELPARYAEFLNSVRWLITSPERKTFLSTPDADKERFIEDFWTRRDPDPTTPENEVKSEYFARISQANELFRGEAVAGWLSDRGRIHILYGPPTERRIQPSGETSRLCQEAWYYGNYPLLFNDTNCSGTYRLETFDLTPLKDLNLNRTAEPGAAGSWRGMFSRGAEPFLDFTAEAQVTTRQNTRWEGLVWIEIPFRRIWFKSESGRFRTTFDVSVEIRDVNKGVVWEKTISSEADFPERDIKDRSESVHTIEIPLVIDREEQIARLTAGPVTINASVTNRTGSEVVKKTIVWK